MNKSEIKKGLRLLGDRVERHEITMSLSGGQNLTVYWVDGGQKLFTSLQQINDWLQSKEEAKRCIE